MEADIKASDGGECQQDAATRGRGACECTVTQGWRFKLRRRSSLSAPPLPEAGSGGAKGARDCTGMGLV